MNNYTESKKQLDTIRNEYSCAGDIIFRTAIMNVIDWGRETILDDAWLEDNLLYVDQKHDEAESEGKILIMTRDFEKAIINCTKEVAKIPPYDLMIYVQREIYLGGDGISYRRAIELLIACVESICENHSEDSYYSLEDLRDCCDFDDSEIEELGFGWLLEEEEE